MTTEYKRLVSGALIGGFAGTFAPVIYFQITQPNLLGDGQFFIIPAFTGFIGLIIGILIGGFWGLYGKDHA